MDSRERAAVKKEITAAMDAVNTRQDEAIRSLGEEVKVIRDVLMEAGIWPKVKAAAPELPPPGPPVPPIEEQPKPKVKRGKKAEK